MADGIDDLKPGDPDPLGVKILRIYSREPGKYIIYETVEQRVGVDGPETEGCNQPGINQVMMEIADITIHNPELKKGYNSRIAHSYKIALDGDGKTCEAALREIVYDMSQHLRRACQRAYQIGALLGVLIPPVVFFAAFHFWTLNDLAIRLLTAAVFAAVGGFFSVLIGSRKLDLDLKESFTATMIYGFFRIVIAVISGIVVVFLIRADLLLGPLNKADSIDSFALACFVTGFSERLIPNVGFRTMSSAGRPDFASAQLQLRRQVLRICHGL